MVTKDSTLLLPIFILVLIGISFTPADGADEGTPVSLIVDDVKQQSIADTSPGHISVTFKITSGRFAGDTVLHSQQQWGHPQYDPNFGIGRAFTGEIITKNGAISRLIVHQSRKDIKLLILFGLVTLILFVVGRWEGLVGLFSTVATVLMIFYVFFPTLQTPVAILPIGITICLITIILTVSLVMKWNKPTFPAIFSLIGVFFVILFLTIVGLDFLSLDATKTRHSRLILSWIDNPSSFWKLLTVGIVLGTLGAMMDVAVVISSTVNEITRDAEQVTLGSAFRSGLTVGREILSTMLNTLVFAYLGILFPLLLSFRIFNLSWIQFLNYDFVGIEILRICIGLVGLSLIIPITSLLSAWWCRRQ